MLAGLRLRLASAVGVLLFCATSAHAAPLIDPRLSFRSLATEHFVIYFHQGEDAQAARLGIIAEDVWRQVSERLIPAPRRTHVILVDQSDLANGWATPLPRNTILVTATAPSGSEFIGRSEDWLRLVFTHEFAHIVHLDRSEGWAKVARKLFGRNPLAFPNLLLPAWQIEGLATWEESALPGQGRLHAGDFRAIEREAARAGRLEPLDRLNGGLTDWPNGLGVYAYGLGFHEYLSGRFGEATLGRLAAETARSIPFLSSRAFRKVYGQSLASLWADYHKTLAAEANPSNPETSPVGLNPVHRLTHHGHIVIGPRFAPSCRACEADIVYSVRNPDGFPALWAATIDGTRITKLADRYLGSTVGVGPDFVVFDQQEVRRDAGLYSDLFLLDRRTDDVHALTSEQRLRDPDLSPDGRTIVSVRETLGRRELMLVHLAPLGRLDVDTTDEGGSAQSGGDADIEPTVEMITTLVSEPETQFDAPRWSPDGQSIAVARQRLAALSEIVIVDVATRAIRRVASHPSARVVTPTWRPDGGAIVAAADYDERPFDLFEFALDGSEAEGRRLTYTSGGATWPDVSPDGATIVFVGYTPDGFDLFTTPYRHADDTGHDVRLRRVPRVWDPASAGFGADSVRTSRAEAPARTGASGSGTYSPWRTLTPTSWTPIVEGGDEEFRVGLAIGGSDVLERHGYSASTTWLVNRPETIALPHTASPDWQLEYAYDRWVPTFFISASQQTSFGAGSPDAAGRPISATLREAEITAGVLYPIEHIRATHHALASLVRSTDHFTFADRLVSYRRAGARLGWTTSTAQTYGYSISPEHGLSIGGTVELDSDGFGFSAGVTTVTADGRAYLRGAAAHHVLALRAAAGASSGERDRQRVFHLGGASANANMLDFGRDAISLLRGFGTGTFAGNRVALLNADYRWPIARPQRGVGTMPLLLHSVHASAFADAGHAWTRTFNMREVKFSAGGELSLDVIAVYSAPLTLAVGAAWGHDRAGAARGSTVYARLGRAF
jgi:WD40-like Beta Propeller Repeat